MRGHQGCVNEECKAKDVQRHARTKKRREREREAEQTETKKLDEDGFDEAAMARQRRGPTRAAPKSPTRFRRDRACSDGAAAPRPRAWVSLGGRPRLFSGKRRCREGEVGTRSGLALRGKEISRSACSSLSGVSGTTPVSIRLGWRRAIMCSPPFGAGGGHRQGGARQTGKKRREQKRTFCARAHWGMLPPSCRHAGSAGPAQEHRGERRAPQQRKGERV